MSSLYLSQLRIARSPQVTALTELLNPEHAGQRMDAHHRLLWSAFSGDPTAQRDFLWRDEGRGVFLVLSARPPAPSPFFEQPETLEFALALRAGDRLAFALRANATRTVETGQQTSGGKPRKVHRDVVMELLHSMPPSERASARMSTAQTAAETWMARQGERHGFQLNDLELNDYSVRALPGRHGPRNGQPQFGVLDLHGRLTVTHPELFLPQLAQGFGRAKAFGCGLMLIRRG